jgi:hypothetical protein
MRWWLAPGFLELEITVPWRVQRIQGRYPRWKRSVDISINLCLPLYIHIIYNLLSISICHCLSLFIIYDIDLLSFTYVLSIYVWTLQTILLETWGIFTAMLDCWVKTPGFASSDADRNSARASSPRGFARGAHDPGPSWAPGRNARWSDESDVSTSAVQNLRVTPCSSLMFCEKKQPQVIVNCHYHSWLFIILSGWFMWEDHHPSFEMAAP